MPEKTVQNGGMDAGFPFEKPPDKSVLEVIGTFIYDSKNGKYFTRTPLSWAKIILFYCMFYGVLACMFSGCVYMLLRSLDRTAPRWQLDESKIGAIPGLSFRPMSPRPEAGHTLISSNTKFNTQKVLVEQLNEFLQPYQSPLGPEYEVCDYARSPSNRSAASCTLEVAEWEPCTPQTGYGFNANSPCIFLKLNKIFGWEPDFYNPSDLPDDMPDDLKQHILNTVEEDPSKLKTIWVSCNGENAADRQFLGPVQYIPQRGFPGYFYPYINTKGYLSPLVALHLERPTVGVIIHIECRAWAKNIHYDKRINQGNVIFQLFVD